MDQIVNLSTGKTFDILSEYPAIDPGDKIGIMFTGGVESYLVARIAKQVYGIDNIIFILIQSNQYSNYSSNKDKIKKVKHDFYENVGMLGGVHTFEVGEDVYFGHDFAYSTIFNEVKNKFPTIKHIFAGYSNIHKESLTMLLDCGWDKGQITIDDVNNFFDTHKDNYPELKRFMAEMKGDFYFVNEVVGFEHVVYHFYKVLRPLDKFTKVEVVEIFKKLNLLEELFNTTSCNTSSSLQHCGVCKNCLHRKDAIQKNGIHDLTVYG